MLSPGTSSDLISCRAAWNRAAFRGRVVGGWSGNRISWTPWHAFTRCCGREMCREQAALTAPKGTGYANRQRQGADALTAARRCQQESAMNGWSGAECGRRRCLSAARSKRSPQSQFGASHSCSSATRRTTHAVSDAAKAPASARRPAWQWRKASAVSSPGWWRPARNAAACGHVFAELVAGFHLGAREERAPVARVDREERDQESSV